MDLLLSQLAHPNFVVTYDHRSTTIYRNEGSPNFNSLIFIPQTVLIMKKHIQVAHGEM